MCFLVCILACVGFVPIFDPNSFLDHGHLVFLVLTISISGFLGTVLWLLGTEFEKREKEFGRIFAVFSLIYLTVLISVLLGSLEVSRNHYHSRQYSLTPFRTIKLYLNAYRSGALPRDVVFENLFYNFVLLTPLGFIAPYFIKPFRTRWWLFSICVIAFICLLEFLQYVTMRGFMDIDDVMLNYAGAIVAYIICWNGLTKKLWRKIGIIA